MDASTPRKRFSSSRRRPSSTLSSRSSSPDTQDRRSSSGSESESESDDDGSVSHYSHLSRRAHNDSRHYGGYSMKSPFHSPHRGSSRAAPVVYADDTPYNPPSTSTAPPPPPPRRDPAYVPFNPSVQHYNAATSRTTPSTRTSPTISRSESRESSPTGSRDAGGSERSSEESPSAEESASNGSLVDDSPLADPVRLGEDAFGSARREPPPGYNPRHYPAYNAELQRVGMETSVPDFDGTHYHPRTRSYPEESPSLEQIQADTEGFYGRMRVEPAPIFSGDDAFIPLPVTDDDIRSFLNLAPDQELSLNALPDPRPGERPGQPLPILAQFAILGSPQRRLTLQEIYQALEDRFEWFRQDENRSWQKSLRHALSLQKVFKRQPKPITEPGKGGYWVLDYSIGPGTKRPRKRNKRKTKAQKAAESRRASTDEEGSPDYDESSPSPPLSQSLSILMNPAPQDEGHRVGHQGRRQSARRTTRRSASRASPYAEAPQLQDTRPSRHAGIELPAIPGSRNVSATFGQPSFGQPSLGPAAVFGQPSLTMSAHPLEQALTAMTGVPPAHPRAVSAAFPSSTLTMSTRSFTQPVPSSMRDNIDIDPALFAEDAAFAGGLQLQGTGISGRFLQHQHQPQLQPQHQQGAGLAQEDFVQGSSRMRNDPFFDLLN